MRTLDQAITQESQRAKVQFPADCETIRYAASKGDIDLTFLEAEAMWLWHSNTQDAQWLKVPSVVGRDDSAIDEILEVLTAYILFKANQP